MRWNGGKEEIVQLNKYGETMFQYQESFRSSKEAAVCPIAVSKL